MRNKIKKINELTLLESFIQTDYFKGYKYIDKAGEIVNHFHKERLTPEYSMDLNGLVIFNPDPYTDQLRVTSNSLWAHYVEPDSLDQATRLYIKKAETIFQILEIVDITRIGWRNYYAYSVSSKDEGINILKQFSPVKYMETKDVLFYFKNSIEQEFNIKIGLIKKSKEDAYSLLFDIDIYRRYDSGNEIKDSIKELSKIQTTIQGENILEVINSVLAYE